MNSIDPKKRKFEDSFKEYVSEFLIKHPIVFSKFTASVFPSVRREKEAIFREILMNSYYQGVHDAAVVFKEMVEIDKAKIEKGTKS